MKSLDLRIGNLVERLFEGEHNDFEEVTVRTLWEMCQVEASNTSKFQFEPIPLTEEWLIRFGFKKEKVGAYGGQDKWAGMPAWSLNGEWMFRGTEKCLHLVGYFNTQIHYVHQLQNLYFCLTGQELTLAPPQR